MSSEICYLYLKRERKRLEEQEMLLKPLGWLIGKSEVLAFQASTGNTLHDLALEE